MRCSARRGSYVTSECNIFALSVKDPNDLPAYIRDDIMRFRDGYRTPGFTGQHANVQILETQILETLACALGTAPDVAQAYSSRLSPTAPNRIAVTDFPCQLQRFRSTGGDTDGHLFLEVDPSTSRIEESNHPPPAGFLIRHRLPAEQSATDIHVLAQLREFRRRHSKSAIAHSLHS